MKKRILAVVMTAVMVMGVLAGCGGSSKETKAPETKAPDTAAVQTEAGETEAASNGELTHVNVAFMANYASLWEVATAMNKGYFEEEGLEVQLYMFQDGPTEIAAMESGKIDLSYIGPGAHKLCIKGQADIFCFSHLGDGDCVMGLKSHGVESLADLKGKKVAYSSGTSSETILVRALDSAGLTMDDIEAYDMEISNIVSAMVSGSIDACAPWSPSSATIAKELGDDVVKFCSNTTFSDIAADCASWICMPGYADTNKDVLVKFTRALYKAMDYGSQEANFEEVAGYVAKECGTDVEGAMTQTGDGAWLNSEQLLGYVADGTIKGYYEVQMKNFLDAGAIEEEVPVEDFVLFDVMEEAGK